MGGAIEIVPADDARGRAEFLRVAGEIQGHDPCWVAPLRSRELRRLDPAAGPFFESGEARLFIARRGGAPCGRIGAHTDRRYERLHDTRSGFFGFFECAPDPAVAAALFGAVFAWLRDRGKTRVLGPMSFSIYDDIGVLTDGFDSLPPILLTHNPPYYGELVTRAGFRKSVDWHALRITGRDVDADQMAADAATIMGRTGLTLRRPGVSEVFRRTGEIMDLFNEAWEGNWGHIPFTAAQFRAALGELRPLLRPDLVRIVLDGGAIVAFCITIPDLNPLLQTFGGTMSPVKVLRLLAAAHLVPLRRVKTVLLGVRRAWRNRKLHDAMILDTYAHLMRTQPRLAQGDCSLICEQLRVFIRSLERFGARVYKTYRIYERDL